MAAFVIDSGIDHTGLGGWSWYLVEGQPGHVTYLIAAYAHCGNTRIGEATVYEQQERFIEEKILKTNPQTIFCEGILGVLRRWW